MLYQAALRAELTRRLGVAWGPVSEHGQAELAGIPQQLLARFSTRTAEVEAAAEAKITELERALGRAVGGRRTRAGLSPRGARHASPKPHEPVAELSLYERWAAEARDAGWEPAAVVQAAIGRATPWCAPHPGTRGQRRRGRVVRRAGDVHPPRRRASRRPPRRSRRRRATQASVRAHVERLADAVLADPMVVCLQPPERVEPPPASGAPRRWERLGRAPSSVGTRPASMLRVEGRHLARGADRPRRRCRASSSARCSTAPSPPSRSRSARDQHDALRAVTSRGRRVEDVIGPAGSGKTSMLRVAARGLVRLRAIT